MAAEPVVASGFLNTVRLNADCVVPLLARPVAANLTGL